MFPNASNFYFIVSICCRCFRIAFLSFNSNFSNDKQGPLRTPPTRKCAGIKTVRLFGSSALGYKHPKSCKILPKFLPTLHFLQESYKFVQESQILQICYNVENFVQDSDNISTKIAFFRKKFSQKMRCVILTENLLKTVTFVQFCVFSE